jgi:hypothetical protein
MTNKVNIRTECLKPAFEWLQPTGEEIQVVLKLAELSGSEAAITLGLGTGGGRTVRRWTGGDNPIPYSAWALLCEMAGLGQIWCIYKKPKK